MRKLFLLCSLVLLASLKAMAYDFESGGVYYTITGSSTVSVSSGAYAYAGEVTIPATVANGSKTYSVTAIAENAFKSATDLESVILPEGLTTIGTSAFQQSGIKTVSLPSTLSNLGESAFRECKNLTLVELPNALKTVKQSAFQDCSSLKTLILGNQTVTIEEYAFRSTAIEHLTIPKTVKTIGKDAFRSCTKLISLTIEDAPMAIGESAFYGCTNLENVNLGNAIYGLGSTVFRDCTNLKSISLPNSLTSTGEQTFYGCSKLYDVALPNTMTEIGNGAFYGCAITEIQLPASLISIGNNAFANNPIVSINFPSNLKTIGGSAFSESSLQQVIIPNSVIEIQSFAFYGCKSLRKVVIENAPVTLSDAFSGCTALETVDLGNAVVAFKSPGQTNNSSRCGSFRNCTSLSEIIIPNSVTNIETATFQGCSNLEHIAFSNNITTLASSVLSNCQKLKNIDFPNALQTIEHYCFNNCTSLAKVILPNSLKSIDYYAFSGCTSLTNIVIPENVTSVGSHSFDGCINLKNIIIDNAVTEIQSNAFKGCISLTNVEFGKATTLGGEAFKGCTQLTEIVIPNTVGGIDGSAFSGCTSLKSIVIGSGVTSLGSNVFEECVKLTNVEFKGNALTKIGDNTFRNCRSLKKIELPALLASIGSSCFNGCTVLQNVYSLATTPPTISANTFADYTTPMLHVPASAVMAYTRADNWKQFENVIAIGSEPKASADEIAALEALVAEAQTLYDNAVEGAEPGNYRPGAKAALMAVIMEVKGRISDTMLSEDVEDCIELLTTAMQSFRNKQVRNDVQTANTLTFISSMKAAIGANFVLPIEMNNADNISTVQFDLYLPEGMLLGIDEQGNYDIRLSDRTTAGQHAVSSRVMDDGALRIVVTSAQNAVFSGNSGTLLTLSLFPQSTIMVGDHDVELRNIVLTDPQATRYVAPDIKSTISVSTYTLGDVNDDGYIDVADLTGIVHFILETAEPSLVFNAADMDGNGVVEVNDYAALVNVIMEQEIPASSRTMNYAGAALNNVLALSNVALDYDGNGELKVELLSNEHAYTGLQFDLVLPAGCTLEGVETTSSQHGVWSQQRADGIYRVLCSSMTNAKLSVGTVISIKIKADDSMTDQAEITATNVILASTSATRYTAPDMKSVISVAVYTVGDVNDDGYVDVADVAGVVCFILDTADASLVFKAADVDGNGVVEVTDYVALVNIILGQDLPVTARVMNNVVTEVGNVVGLGNVTLDDEGNGELEVRLLSNEHDYTGLQFDLALPDGCMLAEDATTASSQHGVWSQQRADGSYRVLCASLTNAELPVGTVIRLAVKAIGDVAENAELAAINVLLASTSAERYEAASARAEMSVVTGISETTAVQGAPFDVYTTTGVKVRHQVTTLEGLPKGVYVVNGRKVALK